MGILSYLRGKIVGEKPDSGYSPPQDYRKGSAKRLAQEIKEVQKRQGYAESRTNLQNKREALRKIQNRQRVSGWSPLGIQLGKRLTGEKKTFFEKGFAAKIITRSQKSRKGQPIGAKYGLPGGVAYRIRKSPTGKGGRFAGRPKESFKPRINPFTGQMVRMPALPYYKLIRRYNMMLRGKATGNIQMQQAQLARRGVPPSIAAQILAQRQMQAVQQVQQPQQVQMQMPEEQVEYVEHPASAVRQRTIRMPFQRPTPVMPRQLPIPQPAYREEIDIMTGRPINVPNWAGKRERWTYD